VSAQVCPGVQSINWLTERAVGRRLGDGSEQLSWGRGGGRGSFSCRRARCPAGGSLPLATGLARRGSRPLPFPAHEMMVLAQGVEP
jgi:hypothetical protein